MIKQINQAQAMAGGITPGDTPGFPVRITVPGSYELTSNLEVPAGKAGIEIIASHVTLNLNGFLIFKKVADPGVLAISAGPAASFISVSNGHIQGMGGISLAGSAHRVELVQFEGVDPSVCPGISLGDFGVAVRNQVTRVSTGISIGKSGIVKENVVGDSGHGVSAGENAIVEGNTVDGGAAQASIRAGNGSIVAGNIAGANDGGIEVGAFSLVKENTVRNNGDFGIGAGEGSVVAGNRVNHVGHGPGINVFAGCTVRDNTVSGCGEGIRAAEGAAITVNAVRNNAGFGLTLGPTSGYAGNVLVGNNGAGPEVSGGIQTDKNVCGAGLCP